MLLSRNPSFWSFPSLNPNQPVEAPLPRCSAPLTFACRPVSSPLHLCVAYSDPPMASQKVAAEYAKSNRSSCKACGKNIPAGSLRLGLSSKDPRGFDMTKWHHLDCFPVKERAFPAVGEIKGFSLLKVKMVGVLLDSVPTLDKSLIVLPCAPFLCWMSHWRIQSSDQEALKKLELAAAAKPSVDEGKSSEKDQSKKGKKRDLKKIVAGGEETEEEGETMPKKPRHGDAKEREEIVFSISDIKAKYKDASLPPKWKAFQTVIFREADDGLCDSDMVAAFDFDGCLVNTSVKRIGPDAWSLLYPSIPEKLQKLYNDGYKLVIFTNESNIERWKNKRQVAVDSKIGRLENFLKHVKVPMQVFIACGLGKGKDQTDDPFRKPNRGMWRILEQHFNSGITIDLDRSFFVGDAAGRSNDHSDADAKFAEAVGLKFHLPEDFFKTNRA